MYSIYFSQFIFVNKISPKILFIFLNILFLMCLNFTISNEKLKLLAGSGILKNAVGASGIMTKVKLHIAGHMT